MLLLGLDLETTGLDYASDFIIEIGVVVWDTEKKQPISMMSQLVQLPAATNDGPSREIMELTGITIGDLSLYGKPLSSVMMEINDLAMNCQYLIGHNAIQFDRLFLERQAYFAQLPALQRPWIDTMFDLPYPDHIRTRRLDYLAAEHGFMPWGTHRAIYDVMTTLRLLSHYDIGEVLVSANSPLVELTASVSYERKHLARHSRFFWRPERKAWCKIVRKAKADMDLPFDTSVEVIYSGKP